SPLYAEELGLDPRTTYRAILDDLRPQALRLVDYWNRAEKTPGANDFSELDWQIQEAETRHLPVTLAIGYRTPRWPECHIPDWANKLPPKDFEKALDDHLRAVVEHYKNSPAVVMWQVENEPLLSVFGQCPTPDEALLKREVAFVRSLDSKPVMVTDSGELGFFPRAAGLSDVFGTTLYRYIWNKTFGFFTHIFPPPFYTLRAWLTTTFSSTKHVVIAELQAEPWSIGERPIAEVPFQEQTTQFGVPELKYIVGFAKRTGIEQIYLWGPEWWYYRLRHGDPSFWKAGQIIFLGL
ncbi:MAG TPA: hypothetical protein VMC43_01775, partial [Candidatus Paceibacterota bacterium]|nr:hypothetical protein [Candidatus Paceibacterota bacterium]